MATTEKNKRKTRQLVLGFLERVSSSVFSDFPKQLTDLVGKQHGVYSLYKGKRLYYVGLATNLRNRIRQHLRDRHAGKWDIFSLYLIRKEDHIKELESLILRIADPTGNATRGRLPKAKNLHHDLHLHIKNAQAEQLSILLDSKYSKAKIKMNARLKKTLINKRQPSLKPFIKKQLKIRATYKAKIYNANVSKNGIIKFNNALYNSPSLAGQAVTGKANDGWLFWRFKKPNG